MIKEKWLKSKALLFGFSSLFVGLFFIGEFLQQQIVSVCNPNYGFGFYQPKPFFLYLEVGALLVLVWLIIKAKQCADKILFSILLTGGILNVTERFWNGCVTDYITVPVIGSQVNIPDILITVSIIILLGRSFHKDNND